MVGWIVGKLKWLLLLCAVGGPIVAASCWYDGNRRRAVMADGVQAVATIEGAKRVKRRRSGTTYKVDLSWTDTQGARRTAEDVSISHAFARQIIVDDRLMAATLPIKYMASAPQEGDGTLSDENLVVLDDEAEQERSDAELVYVGAGVGVVGLIGSGLFFLPRRRREGTAAV